MQLGQNEEVINPCIDSVFKAIFTTDTYESKEALKDFLYTFIGKQIDDVVCVPNEPAIDNLYDKQIRFDVSCKFNTGELANIEVNLNAKTCAPKRLEYYMGRLFLSQNIRNKNYTTLHNAYQIFLIINGVICDNNSFINYFEYYEKDQQTSLNGATHIITIEASKLKETDIENLTNQERWIIFFKYVNDLTKRELINTILNEERGIEMATKTLLTISKDETAALQAMSREKFILDRQSDLIEAKREGMEEGRQEGIKEGEQKGRHEIAKEMLKKHIEIYLISELTGLSIEEIKKLKNI